MRWPGDAVNLRHLSQGLTPTLESWHSATLVARIE